jgi:hypothetical protein
MFFDPARALHEKDYSSHIKRLTRTRTVKSPEMWRRCNISSGLEVTSARPQIPAVLLLELRT